MNPGTGYRWLKVGEVILPGDELWGNLSKRWVSASVVVGSAVQMPEQYRRPVDANDTRAEAHARKHAKTTHARAVANLYKD